MKFERNWFSNSKTWVLFPTIEMTYSNVCFAFISFELNWLKGSIAMTVER